MTYLIRIGDSAYYCSAGSKEPRSFSTVTEAKAEAQKLVSYLAQLGLPGAVKVEAKKEVA